jgi:hypothetical protein
VGLKEGLGDMYDENKDENKNRNKDKFGLKKKDDS